MKTETKIYLFRHSTGIKQTIATSISEAECKLMLIGLQLISVEKWPRVKLII